MTGAPAAGWGGHDPHYADRPVDRLTCDGADRPAARTSSKVAPCLLQGKPVADARESARSCGYEFGHLGPGMGGGL